MLGTLVGGIEGTAVVVVVVIVGVCDGGGGGGATEIGLTDGFFNGVREIRTRSMVGSRDGVFVVLIPVGWIRRVDFKGGGGGGGGLS